jgi:hypothetical protein
MPRYVVERTFPAGLDIPLTDQDVAVCRQIAERSSEDGVIWIESYVSDDRARTYCVVEAPDPEAIRRAARRCRLPVDRITRVTVLTPYPYSGSCPAPGSVQPA